MNTSYQDSLLNPKFNQNNPDPLNLNSTANSNYNVFKSHSLSNGIIDPVDLMGHKDDTLDDLIIEDSYNDYLRDSILVQYDPKADLEKYKKIVSEKDNTNKRQKFVDMPSKISKKEELRKLGDKVSLNEKQNNSVSYKN